MAAAEAPSCDSLQGVHRPTRCTDLQQACADATVGEAYRLLDAPVRAADFGRRDQRGSGDDAHASCRWRRHGSAESSRRRLTFAFSSARASAAPSRAFMARVVGAAGLPLLPPAAGVPSSVTSDRDPDRTTMSFRRGKPAEGHRGMPGRSHDGTRTAPLYRSERLMRSTTRSNARDRSTGYSRSKQWRPPASGRMQRR